MALPSSGSLSLLSLVNEFGGSGSVGLSEYYRGGAFVPDIPTNGNIPTSGTISVSNFYNGIGKLIGSFNIYSNFNNWNLYDRLVADFGWDQVRPVEIYVNQYAGYFFGGTNDQYAMIINNLPVGSLVTLNIYGRIAGVTGTPSYSTNRPNGGSALYVGFSNTVINVYSGGYIIGGGGAGGDGASHLSNSTPGGNGGHGIVIDPADNRGGWPRIYNYGGIIGGGGGGGGGGSFGTDGGQCTGPVFAPGGGGGAGQTNNLGFCLGGLTRGYGYEYTFCLQDAIDYGGTVPPSTYGGNSDGRAGDPPGAGGNRMRTNATATNPGGVFSGVGGSGGSLGNAGAKGGAGTYYGGTVPDGIAGSPGAGGSGGYAKLTLRGSSTTFVQGTTYGTWA
jgi:hypothetical protein